MTSWHLCEQCGERFYGPAERHCVGATESFCFRLCEQPTRARTLVVLGNDAGDRFIGLARAALDEPEFARGLAENALERGYPDPRAIVAALVEAVERAAS